MVMGGRSGRESEGGRVSGEERKIKQKRKWRRKCIKILEEDVEWRKK